MAKTTEMVEVSISQLKPYERNAKQHPAEQIERLKESIREFGFISPCLIDSENNILAGHGRVEAAKAIGMKSVPCVYVEGLTDAQRRAYILADNRLTELARWDEEMVAVELEELADADFVVELTGFDIPEQGDWFENRERNDTSREEGNDEYNDFLEKFEAKKTTDDCYTPDVVYDAVAGWVVEEYNVKRDKFVRPFYPGGDYQSEKYASDAIVVDNPPFSILAEILRFYDEHGIKFFLFAPTLTLFSSSSSTSACALCCGVAVLYENGASVNTSFLTNLEDNRLRSCPELYKRVSDAVDEYRKEIKAELPKYDYPYEVVLSTGIAYLSKYGEDFKVSRDESEHIRQLDAQKEFDKALYGSGYLISERAAAERAAAERAAAERANAKIWTLSDREMEIVKGLGGEA